MTQHFLLHMQEPIYKQKAYYTHACLNEKKCNPVFLQNSTHISRKTFRF